MHPGFDRWPKLGTLKGESNPRCGLKAVGGFPRCGLNAGRWDS